MDPHIQDWTTVVIKKPTKTTVSQPKTQNNLPSGVKIKYDEDGEEIVKLKNVSHEMAQFIIKTRTSKDMKQTDLAKKANLNVKSLAEIERGGCVYNAGDINKIAKALGVNIPRK
jgi:ribosome-binding protein aMBF1 (putative translation factor)